MDVRHRTFIPTWHLHPLLFYQTHFVTGQSVYGAAVPMKKQLLTRSLEALSHKSDCLQDCNVGAIELLRSNKQSLFNYTQTSQQAEMCSTSTGPLTNQIIYRIAMRQPWSYLHVGVTGNSLSCNHTRTGQQPETCFNSIAPMTVYGNTFTMLVFCISLCTLAEEATTVRIVTTHVHILD